MPNRYSLIRNGPDASHSGRVRARCKSCRSASGIVAVNLRNSESALSHLQCKAWDLRRVLRAAIFSSAPADLAAMVADLSTRCGPRVPYYLLVRTPPNCATCSGPGHALYHHVTSGEARPNPQPAHGPHPTLRGRGIRPAAIRWGTRVHRRSATTTRRMPSRRTANAWSPIGLLT